MHNPIRITDGVVEAEALTHRHPTTGHTIELIGVLHIADQAFWNFLNTLMRMRVKQGYVIHYELVNGTPDSVTKDRAGKMLARMRTTMDTMIKKGREAGLTYQMDAIEYPANALNTDMSKDEVRQAFKKVPLLFPLRLWIAEVALGAIPTAEFKRIIAEMLAKSDSPAMYGGIDRGVLLDERNLIASQSALASRQPVIAIWGAAHLAGISQNLQRAGYKVVRQDWYPVYSYPVCPHHG